MPPPCRPIAVLHRGMLEKSQLIDSPEGDTRLLFCRGAVLPSTRHRRRDGLASPRGGDVPQDARGRSTPSRLVGRASARRLGVSIREYRELEAGESVAELPDVGPDLQDVRLAADRSLSNSRYNPRGRSDRDRAS